MSANFRTSLIAAACVWLAACSSSPKQEVASAPTAATAPSVSGPPKITQFYATKSKIPRGETIMLCYGVENATSVYVSPPRHELTVSLTRCINFNSTVTTTATLTAEGPGGPAATKDVTVEVGAPLARIIELQVSAAEIKAGDPLSLCYKVANAQLVTLEPLHFRDTRQQACTIDHPQRVTAYTLTAVGKDGDHDEQKVTINVH